MRFKAEGLPESHEGTTNATSKRGRPLPNSDAPQIEEQLPEKKTRGVAPVYKATGLLTRHDEARTNARMKRGWPYPKDANPQPLQKEKRMALTNSDALQIEEWVPKKKARKVAPVYKGTGVLTKREPRTDARMRCQNEKRVALSK